MKIRPKKFHFIGIGGVGMSGLAEILMQMGHSVSGSDRERSEITDYLAGKGAKIYEGHQAENIGQIDFLVYSSAIPETNPEMQQALKMNTPRIRRAEMLGQLFNRKIGVGIAGTHGKTTTTSMLASILLQTELDPTIVVGGKLQNLMTNARLGEGSVLVAEADEYDRSFLALFPRIAVVTSLEADHLDIYSDLEDIKETFVKYCNQTSFDGSVILCADEENIRAIRSQIEPTVFTYGLHKEVDYRAVNIEYGKNSISAEILFKEQSLGAIHLQVPGVHNIKNALAASVAALELDVPFDMIQRGLESYKGVGRRFEIVGEANGITVVDDYAHHPTEVEATIQAAQKNSANRVIAVFQPHLFSRTKDFYKEFAEVLSQADETVLMDIYPAREEPIPGVTGQLVADDCTNSHYYVQEKAKLVEQLLSICRDGDLVLFMGAGDIWKYSRKFLENIIN